MPWGTRHLPNRYGRSRDLVCVVLRLLSILLVSYPANGSSSSSYRSRVAAVPAVNGSALGQLLAEERRDKTLVN